MSGERPNLAAKDAVVYGGVEQHQREDKEALAPEHEGEARMRCRGVIDGDRKGDHVRPEGDGEGTKGGREDERDHVEGGTIATLPEANGQDGGRDGADRRKDEKIGSL